MNTLGIAQCVGVVYLCVIKNEIKMLNSNLTFGQLTQGTVINFYRPVTADDTNYVVLRQYEDRWGLFTEVLNLSTYEKDTFSQNSKIENQWSVVKEN